MHRIDKRTVVRQEIETLLKKAPPDVGAAWDLLSDAMENGLELSTICKELLLSALIKHIENGEEAPPNQAILILWRR